MASFAPLMRKPSAPPKKAKSEPTKRSNAPTTLDSANRAYYQQMLAFNSGQHGSSAQHGSRTDGAASALDAGATAAGTMTTLSGRGHVHPVSAALADPDVRFRLPTFDKVKAAYTDKDLKIPEAVIKTRVAELLGRMEREHRLKSKDPVPTIIAKIFPGPGLIDEVEFDKAIDVSDRTKIYGAVADADTQVKPGDKPKLKAAMQEAADLIQKVEANAVGLTQVFGAQAALAKANYEKARRALIDVSRHMDTHLTTDYNLDDPEVGLGGWADFKSQNMHLLLRVARVADLNETKATVIHEASHLANPSVDDHIYYGEPGFFELDDATKVANAAHYEELPRREMATSSFDKKTFTPGVNSKGAPVTREELVKAAVNLYMRKAWDAGVDTHTFIREVRRRYETGDTRPFADHRALILEISKLMDLTVHEQAAGKAIVTTLDVTLSESISRGIGLVKELSERMPFPAVGGLTDVQLRDQIVAAAVSRYGNLLRDPVKDKALLDWMVAHYRLLPGI